MEDIENVIQRIILNRKSGCMFDDLLLHLSDWYDRPANNMADLRAKTSTKVKGDLFELFCLKYLSVVYGERIWLLKDVPEDVLTHLGLKRRDIGIDIIGMTAAGYYAVQCKYRKRTAQHKTGITLQQLSTFYALVTRTGPFVRHIVMTNVDYCRHFGAKGPLDLSICYGTFCNITTDVWYKMANFKEGHTLGAPVGAEATDKTSQEQMRAARLARFN